MAALPPSARRRPRPGSLERPVNARTYRGTWLLVALPLLLAAFSVVRPEALPRPVLPPAFSADGAVASARELSIAHPDRRPGTRPAAAAARWLTEELTALGYRPLRDTWEGRIPGQGRVRLQNIAAVATGRSREVIVVSAHRDNTGVSPGANDNASGTAALLELARAYSTSGAPPGGAPAGQRGQPAHTIVFLSTDGGSYGALGADRFARTSTLRDLVVAAVNLESLAGGGRPRLLVSSDSPRSPSAALLATASARILEQTGVTPARPGMVPQLLDLAFPFAPHEQGPFLARGISAVTLTTLGDRHSGEVGDGPEELVGARLGQLGRAAEELVSSLDQGLPLAPTTSSLLLVGSKAVRGWAIELVLAVALLPFIVAAVDLFARCRRRRIALLPAWRSLRSRVLFWAWVAGCFAGLALVGVWPDGDPRPPAPDSEAARDWPALGLTAIAVLSALGWLLARERLLPRRAVGTAEELAGHTAALLSLAVVGLLTLAVNPFALLLLLPSLHAWVWLPNLAGRPFAARLAVFTLGWAGPLAVVVSFASRFGLGWDAPWYIAELVVVGYVPFALVPLAVVWLAAGAQLASLAAHRYAPYPSARERPPRGPVRELVRRTVLTWRRHRSRARVRDAEAAEA